MKRTICITLTDEAFTRLSEVAELAARPRSHVLERILMNGSDRQLMRLVKMSPVYNVEASNESDNSGATA